MHLYIYDYVCTVVAATDITWQFLWIYHIISYINQVTEKLHNSDNSYLSAWVKLSRFKIITIKHQIAMANQYYQPSGHKTSN